VKTTTVTRAARINGIAAEAKVLVVEVLGGPITLIAEVATDSGFADCRTGKADFPRGGSTLSLRAEAETDGLAFLVNDETHPFVFTDVPYFIADYANSPAEYTRTLKAIAERFAFDAALHEVESL